MTNSSSAFTVSTSASRSSSSSCSPYSLRIRRRRRIFPEVSKSITAATASKSPNLASRSSSLTFSASATSRRENAATSDSRSGLPVTSSVSDSARSRSADTRSSRYWPGESGLTVSSSKPSLRFRSSIVSSSRSRWSLTGPSSGDRTSWFIERTMVVTETIVLSSSTSAVAGEMPSARNCWTDTGPNVPTRTVSPKVASASNPTTSHRFASTRNQRLKSNSASPSGPRSGCSMVSVISVGESTSAPVIRRENSASDRIVPSAANRGQAPLLPPSSPSGAKFCGSR